MGVGGTMAKSLCALTGDSNPVPSSQDTDAWNACSKQYGDKKEAFAFEFDFQKSMRTWGF